MPEVPRSPQVLVEELANALQAALLLTASLEQELSGGHRGREFAQLSGAVVKAARAAHELRNWAQSR